ncbi:HzsA-related protein [Saccharobesus litoralis]|nr:PD40 domain-containing protein [Saccharobesus litoralis]
MISKLKRFGSALVVLVLSSCDTGTSVSEENADPILVEFPVAYIERDLITNPDRAEDEDAQPYTVSARNPFIFNPGARLVLKANAFAGSKQTDLTSNLFAEGARIDLRDLIVSPDGSEFLVSLRAPQIADVDEDQQPTWNIWRYKHQDKSFKPVIQDASIAEQGHDMMPAYLPDGRIVFSSTRQKLARAILLDEGRPQYSALDERMSVTTLNLHVMSAQGDAIEQITFNMSHDFYPLVLQDGTILYSRWDTMGGHNKINLYKMLPDGTENHLLYGWHSHEASFDEQDVTLEFIRPQQLPDGKIFMMLGSEDGTLLQKRPVLINSQDYIDRNQTIASLTTTEESDAIEDYFSTLNAEASQLSFSFDTRVNPSGRIHSLFALQDGSERLLISRDLCRVVINEQTKVCGQLSDDALADPELTLAEPLFDLWLLDKNTATQQKVASTTSGRSITEAVVLQPSLTPPVFIADKVVGNELDESLASQQAGAVHIRSVYDVDGTNSQNQTIEQLRDPLQNQASSLPARFMRVVRGVPMPPRDVRRVRGTDFGRSSGQRMREIIGYTPIQPDGSVKFKVPANTPFAISVVDAAGQRVGGRHRQWLSVRPGETLTCNGCHSANSTAPHGRPDAEAASINPGAPSDGVAFANTRADIQPDFGHTMAQALEKFSGLAELTPDIQYSDVWTDSNVSPVSADINLSYQDLATPTPTGADCFKQWSAYCRVQINYQEHIQPLWQLPRQQVDVVTSEVLQDDTCITCHSVSDADGLVQVPAGQLELTGGASVDQQRHLTSYRELFFNDNEQEIVDGLLVDRLIERTDNQGNTVFETNEEGELILDAEGNPIPVLINVRVTNILRTGGARSSSAFFDLFNEGGSHFGRLQPAELRLLREWLDIGGQYYNTPFYPEP